MKLIKKEALIQSYKDLSIDYTSYLQWLDDDENVNNDFLIVSTYNYDTYERELWNIKGREIHNTSHLAEHSAKVAAVLDVIGAKGFVIQHEYSPGIWIPGFILEDAPHLEGGVDKLCGIRCLMKDVDLNNFDGGFLCEDDFKKFLDIFVDYPFLFRYKNIDCLSLDLDLIVKINHHLNIQFISKNSDLIASIKKECYKNELRS